MIARLCHKASIIKAVVVVVVVVVVSTAIIITVNVVMAMAIIIVATSTHTHTLSHSTDMNIHVQDGNRPPPRTGIDCSPCFLHIRRATFFRIKVIKQSVSMLVFLWFYR